MKFVLFVLLLSFGCAEPYYLVANRAIEDARRSDSPPHQETEEIIVPALRVHDRKAVALRYREIKDSVQPSSAAYSYVHTSNRSLKKAGAGVLIAGGLLLLGGVAALATDLDLRQRSPSAGALTLVVALPCMTTGSIGVVSGAIMRGLGFRHDAEFKP